MNFKAGALPYKTSSQKKSILDFGKIKRSNNTNNNLGYKIYNEQSVELSDILQGMSLGIPDIKENKENSFKIKNNYDGIQKMKIDKGKRKKNVKDAEIKGKKLIFDINLNTFTVFDYIKKQKYNDKVKIREKLQSINSNYPNMNFYLIPVTKETIDFIIGSLFDETGINASNGMNNKEIAIKFINSLNKKREKKKEYYKKKKFKIPT